MNSLETAMKRFLNLM